MRGGEIAKAKQLSKRPSSISRPSFKRKLSPSSPFISKQQYSELIDPKRLPYRYINGKVLTISRDGKHLYFENLGKRLEARVIGIRAHGYSLSTKAFRCPDNVLLLQTGEGDSTICPIRSVMSPFLLDVIIGKNKGVEGLNAFLYSIAGRSGHFPEGHPINDIAYSVPTEYFKNSQLHIPAPEHNNSYNKVRGVTDLTPLILDGTFDPNMFTPVGKELPLNTTTFGYLKSQFWPSKKSTPSAELSEPMKASIRQTILPNTNEYIHQFGTTTNDVLNALKLKFPDTLLICIVFSCGNPHMFLQNSSVRGIIEGIRASTHQGLEPTSSISTPEPILNAPFIHAIKALEEYPFKKFGSFVDRYDPVAENYHGYMIKKGHGTVNVEEEEDP